MSGAARRFVSLARCYPEPMSVSTVAAHDATRYDAAEDYAIDRQPFTAARAAELMHRVRWERWLTKRCRARVHVLHCSDIVAAGRVVWRTHRRVGIPYILYLGANEVAAAANVLTAGALGGRSVRLVLGDAAGIVASSDDVASRVRDLMTQARISQHPTVAAPGLGADPALFGPDRDTGTLRQRWGIRRAPIILTVARLSPHRGQDTGIQALALLREEFPELRYVLVGEGSDEARLRNLAADLNVMDRVGFVGSMRDDELPEAYATSTIYLDASPGASNNHNEGHGIALIEAQAAALPAIAAAGARSRGIVRDGETGVVLEAAGAAEFASAIASLLRDADRRNELGLTARESVETHLNWARVARDTARFVRECVANG